MSGPVSSLIADVRGVLHCDWDPIGVSDIPEAKGEYDSYAPQIAGMVANGASEEEIAHRLLALERDQMGLFGDEVQARRVAHKLVSEVGPRHRSKEGE